MIETISKLEQLLEKSLNYLTQSPESEISKKVADEKWSKKEILGYLIDSGIYNLQRFTEVQYKKKPYRIDHYNQDELVKANDYQNAEIKKIIALWDNINNWILSVMKKQTPKTLVYKIELDKNKISDLSSLMKDYVEHLEHHLDQMIK